MGRWRNHRVGKIRGPTLPRAPKPAGTSPVYCAVFATLAAMILLRKYGIDSQNCSAMRQPVEHCVLSTTIHAIPAGNSRTLVRQIDNAVAGDAKMKILVSVVRFRPGPPRTSFTQRPLMQVGVVVSGILSLQLRSISGAFLALVIDQIVQSSQHPYGATPTGQEIL